MGTTAQKLTYLNETKTQLKNTINYSGASITDDTFRQYPRKLYTQYLDILKNPDTLFNGMPKVPEQTGTELTLNDTADTRMKLELNPSDLTQETTTGKNIADSSLATTYTWSTDENLQKIYGNVNLVAGTTYYFSYTIENATTSNTRNTPYIQMVGETTKKYENAGVNYNLTAGRKVWTFTVDTTGTYYYGYWVHTPSGSITVDKMMISTLNDTTYEPYTGGIPQPNPDYPSEVQVIKGNNSIKIENKNLIPFTNQDFTLRNVRYYVENGNLYLNGTSTGETSSVDNTFKTNFSFTLPSGTYTISHKTGVVACFLYKSDNTLIKTLGTDTASQTIALNEATEVFIGFYVYQKTFNDINTEIMISINNGDYVPHQEQVLPLNLPNGMEYCKIGTYEDEFEHDLENDKWYLNKYIGKVVLNGSENWVSLSALNTNDYYAYYVSNELFGTPSDSVVGVISDYFIGDKRTNRTLNKPNCWLNSSASQLYVHSPESTVSDFKAWLSTHNTTVYYQLATPTHDEITDTTLISELNAIEQAVSYDEQTNISQVNTELPFRIKASAIKNLESVFE